MLKFVARRLVEAIPALIGISVISFFLLHLIPGGPAQAVLGKNATVARIAAVDRSLGLNKPLTVQFGIWFWNLLHGQLGTSYTYDQPVTQVIMTALPHTLELVVVAIVLAHLFAVGLGALQGYYRNRWFDHLLTALTFFFWSMPVYWLGIILIQIFAIDLGWFPSGGISNPQDNNPGPLSYLHHAFLPMVVLMLGAMATWSRYMRSSMMDALVQDYIRTARAKGLSEKAVVLKHALRNSLLPIITLFGLSLPTLFGGALFVEEVFNYPGIGLLFWDAANNRDYPILLGVVVMTGVLTVVGNLIADILYGLADPRIQYH